MSTSGIDYGLGQTNIDHTTGIRYGVISSQDVMQAWGDSSKSDYGELTCPECSGTVLANVPNEENIPAYRPHGCADFYCETCKHTLDSADVYSDEPLGSYLDDGEYKASDCLDSDIMIMKSPYYTTGTFCSPCCPGAVSIPSDGDIKAYCFGHDWFDDDDESGIRRAPYTVYRVADGSIVEPE